MPLSLSISYHGSEKREEWAHTCPQFMVNAPEIHWFTPELLKKILTLRALCSCSDKAFMACSCGSPESLRSVKIASRRVRLEGEVPPYL